MRIAIYAPVFVRPTETFIRDAASGLAAAGHSIHVITAREIFDGKRFFNSLHVVSRPSRWGPYYLARKLFRTVLQKQHDDERLFLQRRKLRRCIEKIRPEIILANYGQSGVLLGPVSAELGIPLIVSFHGVDASRIAQKTRWQQRYREMFKVATLATGPSEYVRQRLIKLGCPPDRAEVLHYGIGTDAMDPHPPSERFDGKEVRFLFVGRLTAKKDPITLLRSFKTTCEQLSPKACKLTIVGDGPMQEEVEDLVSDLGLSDNVEMLGHCSHAEVFRCFARAHIYVQHSVTAPSGDEEGLPVSITEAMAAGLPVIATRHSGIPEAVHHGVTGLLVDEGDESAMADSMIELASTPELWDRYGAAGRSLLEMEFSTTVVQKRLQDLLSDAIRPALDG